jgi:integrase
MQGYVYRRKKPDGTDSERWTVVFDEGQTPEGKRQQRSVGGFKTKKEANAALTDRLNALNKGSYVGPTKMTVAEYMTGWLQEVGTSVKPATFKTYESLARTHIIGGRLGPERLQALNPGRVNVFYADLDEGKGLAPETRRLIHSILRKACADAVNNDLLVRNPLERVKRPKGSDRKATAWLPGELRRFLAHVKVEDERLFALWRLAATTGMRRGELLGLTWRALEGGTVNVERQLLATREFGSPKSKRSERPVALDPETVEALDRHLEAQERDKKKAGDAYRDEDLIFCNELGAPIPPNRLSAQFLRHRKAAGIPTGTLHTLRHTAATLMLTNGQPLHVVAARLGDRPETILRVYAHLLPRSDEGAAAGMAELLR